MWVVLKVCGLDIMLGKSLYWIRNLVWQKKKLHYNLCNFSPNFFFGWWNNMSRPQNLCDILGKIQLYWKYFKWFLQWLSLFCRGPFTPNWYKEKRRSGFEVKRIESLCNGCTRILLVWFRMFEKNKTKKNKTEKELRVCAMDVLGLY